jgi:hypothetical protein
MILLLLAMMFLLTPETALAQNCANSSTTQYRSQASGNWGAASTWQCSDDGINWQTPATDTPTSANGAITIRNANNVTVAAGVTVDQVTIDSGGTITVNSGVTWAIGGSGTQLTVNGTVVNAGTVTPTGAIMFNNGSVYRHNQNGGTIPTATWDAAATVEVIGVTTTAPGGFVGQSFGNFTWNSGSQTADVSLGLIGNTTSIRGNLTMLSTGSSGKILELGIYDSTHVPPYNYYDLTVGGILDVKGGALKLATTEAYKLTINGDLIVEAGSLIAADWFYPDPPPGQYIMTIRGTLNVTGGTLDFCSGGVPYGGDCSIPTVNLEGNYNQSGGVVKAGGAPVNPPNSHELDFNFTGTGKTFQGALDSKNLWFHVTNGASLTLNNNFPMTNANDILTVDSGGTLNTGTNVISGAGTFTLASGGTLGIGSPAGITSSGATGNIQTTTRNFNTAANYTYNGSAPQVTGSGLPATVNNLTVNNASGVTLTGSTTVTGALNITAGTFDQGSTNSLTTGAISVSSGATFTNTGTGTITLNGNLTNNGAVLIDGGGVGCRDTDTHITITAAASRTWSGSGAFQLFNVTLRNQTADTASLGGNIVVFGSTDNGGNSGFTFAPCSQAPTAVALKFFTATDYDGKVLLEWGTGHEVNNLGFHLYREEAGKLYRMTPEPVAGSALLAGRNVALMAGRSYTWWDNSLEGVQSGAVKYWVEDIDLSGKRTIYGPVISVPSHGAIPPVEAAALLSRLTQTKAQGRAEVEVEAQTIPRLKPRLSKADIEPLQPMGAGGAAQTPQDVQWALAGATAVKLFVQDEGWYKVTQQELVVFGLDKVDPQRLQLFVGGVEVPMVVTGQKDGKFDSGDAIEFYGTGLDTPSTDTQTYWLVLGTKPGKRIAKATAGGDGKGKGSGSSFLFTVESKPRVLYFSALNNGEGNNKFFGPLISTDAAHPTMLKLSVPHPDPYSPGKPQLQVVLQGVMDGQHTVKVLFNDQQVGQVTFKGQNQGTASFGLSPGALREGENQVKLVAAGGDVDLSLVDVVRLSYYHTFAADDNALRFSANGGAKLTIGGFNSAMIRVMDITDPWNLWEVSGEIKSQGQSSGITISVPGQGLKTLLAFADGWIKEVSGITANNPSSWNSVSKGADVVLISHADFLGALGPLKNLRQSQGYTVAMVDVEDLYDEFNYGNKTPQAIRDFLSRASSNWQRAPRFVLLVGDGSVDPRNYLGYGEFDLVPTRMIQTTYNETVSDDWFVDFNRDGLPEMAIGRIPVRTSSEVAAVVSKIVGYEQSGGGGWTKQVLLVADIGDTFDFEAASADVGALLPSDIKVTKIYRSQFASDELASDELLGSIDQGALLVNYMGHGSETSWRGDLITTDDVVTLTNGLSLPFFVDMTCWNGWFADPQTETLGKSLLKAGKGGAVAVWASSGLTEPDGQVLMNKKLIQLLFSGKSVTLGEAVAKAKAATSDTDVRRTWILLGDPATRFKR